MVVDTSAVLAILFNEKDGAQFAAAIEQAERCTISALNWLEAAVVIDNRGDAIASRQFDLFVRRAGIEVEAVTPEQAQLARQAYRDFGKGRHAAALNFGDCFAYALAKALDQPLLFKGTDFIKTDVAVFP
jgi:ribonuclease VapC